MIGDAITLITPQPLEKKDISLYDYDGTLLYSYSLAEIQELEELPSPSTHEGLTFLRWNWDLSDLKTENTPMIVGANYHTTDGHTRIFVNLDSAALHIGVQLMVNGEMMVDWGDGASETKSANNVTTYYEHQYAAPGEKCITLIVTSGKVGGAYPPAPMLYDADKPSQKTNPRINRLVTKFWSGDEQIQENAWYMFDYCGMTEIALGSLGWGGNIGQYLGNYNLQFLAVPYGCNQHLRMENCYGIKHISLPNGGTSLRSYMLYFARSREDITIPSRITTTNGATFKGGSSLRSVTMGNAVATIDTESFMDCLNLESVAFSSGLTQIGPRAFANCAKLKHALLYSGVSTLGQSAFQQCESLQDINLPSGVTSIGVYALNGCSSLTQIAIPSSVTFIGERAFGECNGMLLYDFTTWTIASLDGCTFSANIFYGITSNTEIRFATKTIRDHAAAITNLTSYSAYMTYVEDI